MGHKVLLADDSITVQKIVKLSLTEEGIEVIAVGNGEQAVQQLETMRPDLVMADVFMPGKDGYEVCEFVKAQPHLKDVPVILLVHAFEPFDPDRAKKVGADQQLTKPFQSIRTLVNTVRDLLQSAVEGETATSGVSALNSISTPPAATAPIISQPIQPEEEFAAVSSLTSEVNVRSVPEMPYGTTAKPGFVMTPAPTPSAQVPEMPEPSLPVPLTTGNGLSREDLLPPPELSVLSPSVQEEPTIIQPEWQPATLPGLTNISPSEAISPSFAPISLAPAAPTEDSFALGALTDDVLDLSDVFPPDTGGLLLTSASLHTNQFATDLPLLAVLGATPAFMQEASAITISADARTLSAETPSATFAGSFDVAAGHLSFPLEPTSFVQASPAQDVHAGTVSKSDEMSALPIPEAVIEEIVTRVIQRLSTNAIQEIAWEIVPEMAEMLIRKQISQQKQLAD